MVIALSFHASDLFIMLEDASTDGYRVELASSGISFATFSKSPHMIVILTGRSISQMLLHES